jgi:hypothetical protein
MEATSNGFIIYVGVDKESKNRQDIHTSFTPAKMFTFAGTGKCTV